jgi:hypothetical protein
MPPERASSRRIQPRIDHRFLVGTVITGLLPFLVSPILLDSVKGVPVQP